MNCLDTGTIKHPDGASELTLYSYEEYQEFPGSKPSKYFLGPILLDFSVYVVTGKW